MSSYNKHLPYIGQTPFFACQFDQRFSYCLYVPKDYYTQTQDNFNLLVIIHGSARTAERYRNLFADFAEENQCIVLAPLFPIGIEDPLEQHNYKYIKYRTIRYDHILQAMINEIKERFNRLNDKILLHGFSGGGQFAHRYFYLHPENLLAVSIGAPGTVTLLNDNLNWWPGTKDIKDHFDKEINLGALRKVQVQLIIGSEDNEEWDVVINENSSTWAIGANDSGKNRLERMVSLRENLTDHNIPVEHTIVEGVGHKGYEVLDDVKLFFQKVLMA